MSEQHEPTEHSHEEHEAQPSKLLIPVAAAIILILAFYGFLLHKGLPQHWTQQANAVHNEASHEEPAVEHIGHVNETAGEAGGIHSVAPENAAHGKAAAHHPPYIMVAPFAALLLCIAILPLIPAASRFWESNTNKFLIAAGLGILTLLYYGLFCNFSIEQHFPGHAVINPDQGGLTIAKTVFVNAIISEFVPFIILLFSLFTITGGIRIGGNLKATPFVNSVILLIGAALASVIGTTGAAMLLIRLLLETNVERKYKVHTVVMFIFCVCNCGGCLTPLGDPPLFLGYLRGIAFEWTLIALWSEWMFVNLILIGFYFLWDTVWFYRREPEENKENDHKNQTSLAVSGWQLNVPLLFGVVAAVALLDPGKAVPGTDWHPWYYLREAVQLGLAAVSLLFGSFKTRKENVFNFLAIGEVAALFFGIFICMQAPLQILNYEGKNIVEQAEKSTGIGKEKLFFWSTGALSSVLDNAPTYVVFFETARSLSPKTDEEKKEWLNEEKREFRAVKIGNSGEEIDWKLLVAVALGAVFMGSMTYIGNGPNFMVKAIAEQSGVKMPSFFGYMVYSCLILLPLLIVMTILFL